MTTGNEPETLNDSLEFFKMDFKVPQKGLIQDTMYCVGCIAIFDAFITARRTGVSRNVLVTVLKRVCVLLKIQDDDVCSGVIEENIVRVAFAVKSIGF